MFILFWSKKVDPLGKMTPILWHFHRKKYVHNKYIKSNALNLNKLVKKHNERSFKYNCLKKSSGKGILTTGSGFQKVFSRVTAPSCVGS